MAFTVTRFQPHRTFERFQDSRSLLLAGHACFGVPEVYRIYPKVHWRCSSAASLPNTLLRRFTLGFSFNFSPVYWLRTHPSFFSRMKMGSRSAVVEQILPRRTTPQPSSLTISISTALSPSHWENPYKPSCTPPSLYSISLPFHCPLKHDKAVCTHIHNFVSYLHLSEHTQDHSLHTIFTGHQMVDPVIWSFIDLIFIFFSWFNT